MSSTTQQPELLRPAGPLQRFIEAPATTNFIMAVIVLNAIVLGLETSEAAMQRAGNLLRLLDVAAISIFVVEILIKLVVYRAAFFRSGWNIFDFLVVAVSLAPPGEGMAVLRALRVMRVLRLVSIVPKMRVVVQALLRAIPGMSSIMALLALVFYVGAVMATNLFGATFDQWFGTVGRSAFSLFQIMTLESWSMGIVRPVMEQYPFAWAFFVPFIICTTFAVLNLFIAIIVNAMHEVHASEEEKLEELDEGHGELLREIRALREEVAALRQEQNGARVVAE